MANQTVDLQASMFLFDLGNSANFGKKWFEIDPVYPVMKLMHWMRIIKLRKAY